VSAACLAVTGLVYAIASLDELTCDPSFPPCAQSGGVGGIVGIPALLVFFIGLGIFLAVRRRPVAPEGYSGWTVALSFLFAIGVLAIVGLIPLYTCPPGTHLDELAGLCINRLTRFDATTWLWLKWLLAIAGVVVGFTVIRRPRWAGLTAPIAVLAWGAGSGWVLVESVGKNVSG
jgi:hypothetical protein